MTVAGMSGAKRENMAAGMEYKGSRCGGTKAPRRSVQFHTAVVLARITVAREGLGHAAK